MDRLTGLADASEFFKSLPDLSGQERLFLVLFDLDDLRLLNEQHGIVEADRVLAHLGSVLRERRGPGEIGARIGGDEFALCLLEDDTTEIVREVERIRQLFGEESGGATLSVGVCEAATLRRASVRLSLIEAAQDTLDEAKRQRPAGLSMFRP